MPEKAGGYSLRIEGDKIVCGDHHHQCRALVGAFRLLLVELKRKDAVIKELDEKILHQEVGGLFKEGN